MGRSYRAIGPARWSMLRVVVERRPECENTLSDTKGTLWPGIATLEYCQAELFVPLRQTNASVRL